MVARTLSGARAEILAQIQAATAEDRGDRPTRLDSGPESQSSDAIGDPGLFATRCADYGTPVLQASRDEISALVSTRFALRGARRIVVPADLPAPWRPPGVEVIADEPPLTHAELASVDGALSGCALAIAATGTIVLDGGQRQGRRALSLLPDVLVCVLRAGQIVPDLADAISRLAPASRPLTLISGPSATSDIELQRVEGVHGPRVLDLILVD